MTGWIAINHARADSPRAPQLTIHQSSSGLGGTDDETPKLRGLSIKRKAEFEMRRKGKRMRRVDEKQSMSKISGRSKVHNTRSVFLAKDMLLEAGEIVVDESCNTRIEPKPHQEKITLEKTILGKVAGIQKNPELAAEVEENQTKDWLSVAHDPECVDEDTSSAAAILLSMRRTDRSSKKRVSFCDYETIIEGDGSRTSRADDSTIEQCISPKPMLQTTQSLIRNVLPNRSTNRNFQVPASTVIDIDGEIVLSMDTKIEACLAHFDKVEYIMITAQRINGLVVETNDGTQYNIRITYEECGQWVIGSDCLFKMAGLWKDSESFDEDRYSCFRGWYRRSGDFFYSTFTQFGIMARTLGLFDVAWYIMSDALTRIHDGTLKGWW